MIIRHEWGILLSTNHVFNKQAKKRKLVLNNMAEHDTKQIHVGVMHCVNESIDKPVHLSLRESCEFETYTYCPEKDNNE